MIGKITANHVIAILLILSVIGMFYLILLKGLGGSEAVFSILGYTAGWISAVVLFFFRKAPPTKPTGTP